VSRGDRFTALPEANNPIVEGPRIEYRRGFVVEWYENRPEGLEQGFTIHKKIKGQAPLEIVLDISGNTRPVLSQDGSAVEFLTDTNARVLRYTNLKVYDAGGKDLPSHLALTGNHLKIVVDDTATVYPIIVDPLLSSPGWTAESDQANAEFGISAAVAGDVNGDG
jgi:hypothetical protein